MRLDKYLSDLGVGTRKDIKEAVRKGLVTVNGQAARDPGLKLKGDEAVAFDGRQLLWQEHVYYMLNKPAGVITAVSDARAATVMDLPGVPRRKDLFPVGRLDKDTVGLLLLTNDGAFDHHLMSPRRHVEKTYYARIRGRLREDAADRIAAGLRVDESLTAAPAELVRFGAEDPWREQALRSGGVTGAAFGGDTSGVLLTLREGKYHQVKRMLQAVGGEVLYLKRISIGPLALDPDLPEGGVRELTQQEVDLLLGRMETGRSGEQDEGAG